MSMESAETYGWIPTRNNDVGNMRASSVPGFHPSAVSYKFAPLSKR